MYEVEVKVRADHDRVREALAREGAEPLGSSEQVDTYYDHPTRSFAATDEALRVRREGERAVLTYKGPKVDDRSKTRREVESGLEDPAAVDAVLRAVGFEPVATVRKTRERYRVAGERDYLVTLDDVAGLGEFVEVEAEADEASLAAVRDGALVVLERLDLDPADGLRAAYLELLADAQE